MKIILSRKGFDSENGKIPNPILPDGTLLSLPIPDKNGNNAFSSLHWEGMSYYDIIHSLKPNTKIKEVQIKSAEVFFEFLRNAGLRKVNVIKRSIPHKLMPTLRDNNTGRFTKLDNPNCKKVYPNEYIIIMRK